MQAHDPAASPDAPIALVLAQSPVLVVRAITELRRRGYEIRYHQKAVDALAQFGEAMPQVAVVGPVAHTSSLDLLLDDFATYGVPVVSASRRNVERSLRQLVH